MRKSDLLQEVHRTLVNNSNNLMEVNPHLIYAFPSYEDRAVFISEYIWNNSKTQLLNTKQEDVSNFLLEQFSKVRIYLESVTIEGSSSIKGVPSAIFPKDELDFQRSSNLYQMLNISLANDVGGKIKKIFTFGGIPIYIYELNEKNYLMLSSTQIVHIYLNKGYITHRHSFTNQYQPLLKDIFSIIEDLSQKYGIGMKDIEILHEAYRPVFNLKVHVDSKW